MTCPTADMQKCEKKCKCLSGDCIGSAYDCDNPCDGGVFYEETCTCGIPYGNYNIYYRQDSSGPVRCNDPTKTACRRRCYVVAFNDVQNIKTFLATTTNGMCCGSGCGIDSEFSNNFTIEGEDINGDPKFVSTGFWYTPGNTYINNAITGTYTNTWTVTGIQNSDTDEFVYGFDCSNDEDLCGGGHPNGECTTCP